MSIASAALLVLAQPPFAAGLLGLVALAPLLLALRGQTAARRAVLGWLCGSIWSFAMVGAWLWPATEDALAMGVFPAFVVTLAATQMYGGVHLGVFAVLCGQPRRGPIAECFAVAAAWVAVELLRSASFGGVPWGLLGHSLWRWPELTQAAALAGVAAVSSWMVVVNAALVEALVRVGRRRSPAAPVLLAIGVLAAVWAHGAWRLRPVPSGDPIPVRVVYSEARALAMSDAEATGLVRRMSDLSRTPLAGDAPLVGNARPAVDARPELTVWPEASVRFVPEIYPARAHALFQLAGDLGGDLAFGAPRMVGRKLFNSYYRVSAIAPDIVVSADKRRLVPLAERRWRGLPAASSAFTAGRGTPSTLSFGETGRFDVMLCFEALFPDLAVGGSGEFLVNPSNDVRVGRGAEQQAAMAVFRAIENGRSLLRVANAGPSMLVDPHGRTVYRERGWGAVLWQVPPPLPDTPFRRIAALWSRIFPPRSSGDGLLAWACLVFALTRLIRRCRRPVHGPGRSH